MKTTQTERFPLRWIGGLIVELGGNQLVYVNEDKVDDPETLAEAKQVASDLFELARKALSVGIDSGFTEGMKVIQESCTDELSGHFAFWLYKEFFLQHESADYSRMRGELERLLKQVEPPRMGDNQRLYNKLQKLLKAAGPKSR